jgi:hypothetical protein
MGKQGIILPGQEKHTQIPVNYITGGEMAVSHKANGTFFREKKAI